MLRLDLFLTPLIAAFVASTALEEVVAVEDTSPIAGMYLFAHYLDDMIGI
jgi:hypothetical protein